MSSQNISKNLGQYMLRGWILTDDICETPGCNVPLMRNPPNLPTETFCANCDGGPIGSPTRVPRNPMVAAAAPPPSAPSASTHSSSAASRASTPITEPPADEEEEEFVLPPVTEEMLQRRAQSDFASSEIGKMLLQGWAMLANECPNDQCFGVPLIRAPKRLVGPDGVSKMECVVCKNSYIYGANGRDIIKFEPEAPTPIVSASTPTLPPPQPTIEVAPTPISVPATTSPAVERNMYMDIDPTPASTIALPITTTSLPIPYQVAAPQPRPSNNVISHTSQALEQSLAILNTTLSQLTSTAPTPKIVGHIGETAHAIERVLKALDQSHRMERDE